jgi:hypothetical protein
MIFVLLVEYILEILLKSRGFHDCGLKNQGDTRFFTTIRTFIMTTLRTIGLNVTLSINDTPHNVMYTVACFTVILSGFNCYAEC